MNSDGLIIWLKFLKLSLLIWSTPICLYQTIQPKTPNSNFKRERERDRWRRWLRSVSIFLRTPTSLIDFVDFCALCFYLILFWIFVSPIYWMLIWKFVEFRFLLQFICLYWIKVISFNLEIGDWRLEIRKEYCMLFIPFYFIELHCDLFCHIKD